MQNFLFLHLPNKRMISAIRDTIRMADQGVQSQLRRDLLQATQAGSVTSDGRSASRLDGGSTAAQEAGRFLKRAARDLDPGT